MRPIYKVGINQDKNYKIFLYNNQFDTNSVVAEPTLPANKLQNKLPYVKVAQPSPHITIIEVDIKLIAAIYLNTNPSNNLSSTSLEACTLACLQS